VLTSLQTSGAEAHLAKGQFIHEKQTLSKANLLICRSGTRRPRVPKREGTNNDDDDDDNNNNNNSIRVYLRANLTAQRPITKLARVYRNT
jgi:hypothetical protein